MKHYNELNSSERTEYVLKLINGESNDHIKMLHFEAQRGPFIQISYKLLNNERFLNEFFYTKRSRVYFLLRQYIVRCSNKGSFDVLTDDYWKNYLLATGLTVKSLCKKLEMSESTVRDQINWLEKEGIILVDRYDASESYNNKPHQIYVLGTRERRFEKYFIDDVFLRNIKPEVPDNDD